MASEDRWFTESHVMFRREFRRFVETELAPHADAWEEEEIFPREVFTRMGELGYFGVRYPESMGGAGGDIWYTVVMCEEFPRSLTAGVPMAMMVQSDMATPIIGEIGTREQIEEFLMPALRGEKIAALGVSEPGAGSDVAGMKTVARKDGDDYVISGSKMWITNGTRADFITLAARTSESKHGGVSLFTFPTNTPGFSVSKKIKKMGNKCSDTAVLYFDECRIPKRYLLGEEGHGFMHIMTNFQGERLVGALMGVAGAQFALDNTIQYCKDREAFGRPLTGFQVTRHRMVDLQTEIEAARRLTYHAAELFQERGSGATKEISMAKLYAAEVAKRTADACVQMQGGMGYSDESFISRYFRDVRLLPIGGGASEIMREILSKLMGL
ncbi:MAG: acyl-CoA dehydrogenase family protein [Myxococcales bacterium]|nr:acyl-CoA dehydrogenase family protein [Myxococcales bacterium]MCB9521170.1 acyl-CoA dehydrogenase family protein [Myxococcales bacterium]MCB9530528.1 acyl-CoA dehydrogenase family protein [Myxococcales bacterium]